MTCRPRARREWHHVEPAGPSRFAPERVGGGPRPGPIGGRGVSASLGSATLVLWAWHYRDAVGGVTVHVLHCDAERSRKILDRASCPARDDRPSWTCGTCSQPVDASWEICWNCGTSRDGAPPAPDAQQTAPEARRAVEDTAGSDLIAIGVLLTMVALVATGDLFSMMAAWAIAACSVAWWRRIPATRRDEAPREAPARQTQPLDDPAEESFDRPRRMGESLALRAWQASVVGILCFPPLLIYSTWLLARLSSSRIPMSARGDRRRWAAWTVSLSGLGLFGTAFSVLLFADAFGEMFHDLGAYFDFSRPRTLDP